MTVVTVLVLMFGQATNPVLEPEMVDASLDGKKITVEGIVASLTDRGGLKAVTLKLAKKTKYLVRQTDAAGTYNKSVQMTGRVRLEDGEVFVDVDSVSLLRSDIERFGQKALPLGDTNDRGWFDLYRWAENRARKYDQPELRTAAMEAYRNGVDARRKKGRDRLDVLIDLRKLLVDDKKLPEYDMVDLEHEIARLEYRELSKLDAQAVRAFANELANRLPSEVDKPERLSEEQIKAYNSKAIDTFGAADGEGRKKLARYWRGQMLNEADRRAGDKVDAYEAGVLARKQFPEYPEFWQTLLRSWTNRAEANMESLTKLQAEKVAETLKVDLVDPKRSREFLQRWLDRRETAIASQPRKSTLEYYELALIHVEWFPTDGKEDAKRLLTKVLDLDSKYGQAKAKLKQMGYSEVRPGTWEQVRGLAQPEAMPERAKTKSALISTGMDAERVLESLGEPTSRSRLVTRKREADQGAHVLVVWAYKGLHESMYILFAEDEKGRAKVTSVKNAK